jgi:hypothetical protein
MNPVKDKSQLNPKRVGRPKHPISNKGRRIEAGEVAYEAYCLRLAEHQPQKCLPWNKMPPYMRDVWTSSAEAVIAHEKTKEIAKT